MKKVTIVQPDGKTLTSPESVLMDLFPSFSNETFQIIWAFTDCTDTNASQNNILVMFDFLGQIPIIGLFQYNFENLVIFGTRDYTNILKWVPAGSDLTIIENYPINKTPLPKLTGKTNVSTSFEAFSSFERMPEDTDSKEYTRDDLSKFAQRYLDEIGIAGLNELNLFEKAINYYYRLNPASFHNYLACMDKYFSDPTFRVEVNHFYFELYNVTVPKF